MSEPAYPTSAAEISDDWLTATLKNVGALSDDRVAGHSWELLPEQGGAGVAGRVRLPVSRTPCRRRLDTVWPRLGSGITTSGATFHRVSQRGGGPPR